MINITLAKEKYRNPDSRLLRRNWDPEGGTRVFNGGRFKSKSVGQGTSVKGSKIQPRRRAYGPF